MDTGEQTCFWYLGSLHTLLNQVDTDINQANNYITWWTDVAYWTWILWSLTTQRDSLKNRQSQTLLAIEDFERSLFNQIKSLLQFYLKEQRTAIIQSVDNLRVQLVASKTVGNKLMFEQHLKSMESLQYKLFLLDRIQFAHDFEELVPFLKEFLYGGGKL